MLTYAECDSDWETGHARLQVCPVDNTLIACCSGLSVELWVTLLRPATSLPRRQAGARGADAVEMLSLDESNEEEEQEEEEEEEEEEETHPHPRTFARTRTHPRTHAVVVVAVVVGVAAVAVFGCGCSCGCRCSCNCICSVVVDVLIVVAVVSPVALAALTLPPLSRFLSGAPSWHRLPERRRPIWTDSSSSRRGPTSHCH